MKNVVILAETEEQMQGIIRGIETLDTNKDIGIIYGSSTDREISEAIKVLIDVAEATVVCTPQINTDGTKSPVYRIDVPNDDRSSVIDYIVNNHKGIIKELM